MMGGAGYQVSGIRYRVSGIGDQEGDRCQVIRRVSSPEYWLGCFGCRQQKGHYKSEITHYEELLEKD